MKRICYVAAVALPLFISGCKKPVAEETEPAAPAQKDPVALVTPPPKGSATPAPVAAATPAQSTPAQSTPAPELAPPGVFYLIAAARIETSSGIQGLPPGTGVKLVRPGIYLTPVGEAALRADQLTNDMALARRIMQADRAAQTALKQQSAAAAAKSAVATTKALVAGAAGHQAALAQIDRERLAMQMATLLSQRQGLENQLSTLQAKRSREVSNEVLKGRIITSTTESSITAVRAQMQALDEQMSQVQRAIDAASRQ